MSVEGGTARRMRAALLLIVLLAFLLQAGSLLQQSLWRDEVDAIRFASRDLPTLLDNFLRSGENGPLYYLLLRQWLALVSGPNDYVLRFFSLLAGVLTVPLAWVLARRLISPEAGLWTALLTATSPYLVWYGQEGKMYALVTVLALAALVALESALRRGGFWRWLAVWGLTTLAAYIHIMALLLIPLAVGWFLLDWPRSRARLLGGGATLAGWTLPYVPIAIWQVRLLFWPKWNPGFPYVPLPEMVTASLTAYLRGILPAETWTLLPYLLLLPLGILLPLSTGEKRRWLPNRSVAMLVLWFLLPLLGLWLLSLKVPLFLERYLIWTVLALILLMAQGLEAMRLRSPAISAVLLLSLLILNGWSLWRQGTETIKADFRSAAAFVAARRGEDELILFLMPYARHTFAHYYGDPSPWRDAPYTNSGLGEDEVAAQMVELTQGWETVWLISSEAAVWDGRGLVQRWLEMSGSTDEAVHSTDEAVHSTDAAAHFTQVEVNRYRLARPD